MREVLFDPAGRTVIRRQQDLGARGVAARRRVAFLRQGEPARPGAARAIETRGSFRPSVCFRAGSTLVTQTDPDRGHSDASYKSLMVQAVQLSPGKTEKMEKPPNASAFPTHFAATRSTQTAWTINNLEACSLGPTRTKARVTIGCPIHRPRHARR